ncbi:MAG: DUF4407 domain-containing protein, partial [Bacteroidetes bacterium]|nr:DUF4407 domain-containing protein [Bacteroidota bacterium]
AAFGGIFSSLIIFTIGRSILAIGRPGKFSLGMFARILLAVTIGFLLAEPITLNIFKDSIKEQQQKEILSEKREISIYFNDKKNALRKIITERQKKLFQLQSAYTQEMDGTGGSRIRNQGPIFQRKYADYLEYKNQYLKEQKNLVAQIGKLEANRQSEISTIVSIQADGLISQLRSLQSLGNKEAIVFWASWLIRFFLIFIELIPVFIKITPGGDRGLYYLLVDQTDKEKEEVMQITCIERKKLNEKEEQIRVAKLYYELCNKEVQIYVNGKRNDSVYLMKIIESMLKNKLSIQQQMRKKIKDTEILEITLAQIEDIYTGFVNLIKQILGRSDSNFSQDNI